MKIFNFILVLFLLSTSSFAQQEREQKKRPKREDNFVRMDGIRVGFDLSRPLQHFWVAGDRYGSELSFDMELIPNLFPVLETGWEKMKITQDYLNYESQGSYTRLGVNYNFLSADHKKDRDIIYIGLRYAFNFASQKVNSYKIENYWGATTNQFPKQKFNAQWAEILLGITGEVLPNLFMGWTIRGKISISQGNFDMPPVYFTPGYGLAENNFNFDFTYSMYYTLPFNFRKK